jgi:hypothetical protein
MNIIILALAIATAGALQIPSAFATVPDGCTRNPHDRDSGPTGNPHDPSDKTSSGFEADNPHDSTSFGGHHEGHDNCPGAQ